MIVLATAALAKQRHDKHHTEDPADQIDVVAHLPLTDGAITRFVTTQHYRREYLYAEHEPGKAVTLIDVTRVDQPSILAEVSYSAAGATQLVAATGNAALVASNDEQAGSPATPQTYRILSFADPSHPAVKQEFQNVTAMARDDKRGLIFLANRDGVWILRQQYASDPQEEKDWEHMMLDAR